MRGRRLAELGFMADIQDTRKCKVAGHPTPNQYIDVDDER
jgi:hypothetical protein